MGGYHNTITGTHFSTLHGARVVSLSFVWECTPIGELLDGPASQKPVGPCVVQRPGMLIKTRGGGEVQQPSIENLARHHRRAIHPSSVDDFFVFQNLNLVPHLSLLLCGGARRKATPIQQTREGTNIYASTPYLAPVR